MIEIVLASRNKKKIAEFQVLLENAFENKVKVLSLDDIGFVGDIVENGETFEENAFTKASVPASIGYIGIAEDSGLCVEALDGAPGVYSARYAGEGCSYQDNVNKLLEALEGVENRKARFKTVIALNLNGEQYLFEGKVEGVITKEQHGEKGFGYDPIFLPDGFDQTFAEMPMEVKNKISHRGRATQKLVEFLMKG